MRVLIAVTHLLGAGHLTRAAALARALASAGHAVTLVSGGAPARLVRLDGVRLVQLDPVHVEGTAFRRLLDEAGAEAGPATLAARRRRLVEAVADTAPDLVVTELFPFGRRVLAAEFLALLEAARRRRPRPLILASIRDILVPPVSAGRIAEAHSRIAGLYDGVLVHGDPALIPLETSWPVDPALAHRLHYTGYLDEGDTVPLDVAPRSGILVSAGSSAAGLSLLRAAAGAARLLPDLGWRILVGYGVPEAAFEELRTGMPDGVIGRARSDYRTLLAGAAVSVSACGYNTAVDLLRTRTPAVLVPFQAGQETEQRLRAERLVAHGLAGMLPEADLGPERLCDAVLALAAAPSRPDHGVALDGAARSVALIEAAFGRHRGALPGRRVGRREFRGLRIALDAAADRGAAVQLWWRDDDAVTATPALERLLDLSARFEAPLLLAAIPALAEPALAVRLQREPRRISLAVHGLAHANHAPAGARRAEFGDDRPGFALAADAAAALRLARARFPVDALLPVFVPPWNRLAPGLATGLADLGYLGLSAVEGPAIPGLARADIHLDPIDWHGTRSLGDAEGLVAWLAERIDARHAGSPIGLLTHHRVHDSAIWDFVADLLGLLRAHPAVTFRDPRALFGPAAMAS